MRCAHKTLITKAAIPAWSRWSAPSRSHNIGENRVQDITALEKLRIGTRGSPLALAQAHEVKARLLAAHPQWQDDVIEICVISTKGDEILDRPLVEIGGKGLFTEEIEAQLLDGRIDIAVHSLKDMPAALPEGLYLSCFLPREDVRDVLISDKAQRIEDLPQGAVLGTASLRRGAQALILRPDLKIVNIRGNVGTRMRKMREGDVDATLLALAGLKRLGHDEWINNAIALDVMLPAPSQGAISIESRRGDARMDAALAPLNHAETATTVQVERAFLASLGGSCRTPIAGLATLHNDSVTFEGRLFSTDGKLCYTSSFTVPVGQAAEMAKAEGERLKAEAGPDFFSLLGD